MAFFICSKENTLQREQGNKKIDGSGRICLGGLEEAVVQVGRGISLDRDKGGGGDVKRVDSARILMVLLANMWADGLDMKCEGETGVKGNSKV